MNQQEFNKFRLLLTPIFIKHKIKQAILFGSNARDTETKKSDIDLLIVKETGKRFFKRYEEFEEMYFLLKDRNLDVLIYTPEELEKISYRKFIKRILEEGKVLYEH